MSAQLLAWCRDADALLQTGRYDDAVRAYRRILSLDATRAGVWYNLGYALKAEGRFEDALLAYDHALKAGIADPQEVHLNRAAIYSDHLRQDALAERELRTALMNCPSYAPALLNLGNLHEERGDRQAAIACYRKIPRSVSGIDDVYRQEALARLAHLMPPEHLGEPLLRDLLAAANAARRPETRANLWFALGQAYEHLTCRDKAFEAFVRGNACCRQAAPVYDPGRQEQLVQAVIEQFASAVSPIAHEESGPRPLFICGMFRSGSTLLEQILAAHPSTHAGGELDLLPRMVSGPLSPFPSSMATVTSARLLELSQGYLRGLHQLVPASGECTYITDKRPDNFLLIGLIKRLFPGARFLHTVRHPLDNGLSVFMNHLDPRVTPYATDLEDIGHYYIQYQRMMAHWKELYPDSIHDVHYDALVRSPRVVMTRALDFLGLDWQSDCLRFHERASTVKTASYWQVRRPLYSEASGRWQHYQEHLAPLRNIMDSLE